MNENHARLCPSPEWAEFLHTEVLPDLVARVDLGEHMLEVGPGPGASTDWLRHRVERLTAVETDDRAAADLTLKYAGTNVTVVNGDATDLTFADSVFDSAGSFTMLHHVPTVSLQDTLLSEVLRVLRPGGVLVGSDSLPSDALREFHEGDTYNPIEPDKLNERLQSLGYDNIMIRVANTLTFVAHKPSN
ncbi:MAG: SAM-dependent methyltransferase [Pseudonocardiales bacterium]|nr:MAG: SAM-dependent methyltransferase [Pseudonocardiales bacterium]